VVSRNSYRKQWDESYKSEGNIIYYPQVEVVRFLNQYIAKKRGDGRVQRLIDSREILKGLDFACGIGTHALTFEDFGIEGFGVDISRVAINFANRREKSKTLDGKRFIVLDEENTTLPFDDDYFDFSVAESCLDSMHFSVAKNYVRELKRVSKRYLYASFMASTSTGDGEEFIVNSDHEKGTVQSLYSEKKIEQLYGMSASKFKQFRKHCIYDERDGVIVNERYYCVVDIKDLNP